MLDYHETQGGGGGLEQTGEGDFVAVVVVLRQQHDVLLVAVVGSEYSLNHRRRCLWPGRSTACKYAWPLSVFAVLHGKKDIQTAAIHAF